MSLFFSIHDKTRNKAIQWDTLKAYVRGVFIHQKDYFKKQRHQVVNNLTEEVHRLEAQYKTNRSKELKYKLDSKINEIKLIEASEAAKEIMYAKQQQFEYRNKPNNFKQLAKILSNSVTIPSVAEVMKAKNGNKIELLSDKLATSVIYTIALCLLSNAVDNI